MPQDRDGTFSTQLFARYQRNEKALVLALTEMYLEGVSTRKVRDFTEALCDTTFSKSLVSELAGQLDAELELVTVLCVEQSEEWLSGRRYLDMSAMPTAVVPLP